MSHVFKALVALAAVALAGYLLATQLGGDRGAGDGGAAPPPAGRRGDDRLPGNVEDRLVQAEDVAVPGVYREYRERLAGPAAEQLDARFAERANTVLAAARRRSDGLAASFRYASAIRRVEELREAWRGTAIEAPLAELVRELREEQAGEVASRCADAEALYAAGRHQAALEALRGNLELEPEPRRALEAFSIALERRIRTGSFEAAAGPPRPVEAPRDATLPAEPGPPPPLPGYPHPDVKRYAEARALLARAKKLFGQSRYAAAAKALEDLVGFYGDLGLVARQHRSIAAMEALARHATRGVDGLFHATATKRKGRRVVLRYAFEEKAEFLDWEPLATIPVGEDGTFEPAAGGGVRGTGALAYLLRGFFEKDVEIRCDAKPNALKTFGLVLCQNELETRQLMWVVANHWFVEGEDYRLERPGHSILMFGKGVNADVPVTAPEVGFIFRGATLTKPELSAHATCRLRFRADGDRMIGAVAYRGEVGERKGSTIGDDGRGIERLRPGLIVVQNSVVFRDVEIEGTLHGDFERRRVSELLDVAALLE